MSNENIVSSNKFSKPSFVEFVQSMISEQTRIVRACFATWVMLVGLIPSAFRSASMSMGPIYSWLFEHRWMIVSLTLIGIVAFVWLLSDLKRLRLYEVFALLAITGGVTISLFILCV